MEKTVIIKKAINQLANEYKHNNNYFFNEHDFHHIFFNLVYSDLKPYIHPEYPTVMRFIREKEKDDEYQKNKHSFSANIKKGRRGHYDFVVLSREFYDKNKYDFYKLSNKKAGINENKIPFIEIALEFKYITDRIDIEKIKFDIFKLREGKEVKNKILIIFTRKCISDDIKKEIKKVTGDEVEVIK